MVKNEVNKLTLADFKFIPFYNALKGMDYESIGVTEEQLEDLTDEFLLRMGVKNNSIEKQLSKIEVELSIYMGSLEVLNSKDGYDREIAEMLETLNIFLYPDNKEEISLLILERAGALRKKYNILKTNLPPTPSNKNKTAYDLLASLSLGLEMTLNFKEVSVMEYIAYSHALESKNKSIKESLNKRKSYGRK